VSGTAELLLAVIAVAVAVMAVVQVGAIVAGMRVARRVEQLAGEIETGVKPLIANLTAVSAEASKAAHLAVAQAERFDQLVSDLSVRLDRTLSAAQHFVSGPARDGMAIVAGVRAAVAAVQGMRDQARRRAGRSAAAAEDEEESLFIG
jgi:hypothetical protein